MAQGSGPEGYLVSGLSSLDILAKSFAASLRARRTALWLNSALDTLLLIDLIPPSVKSLARTFWMSARSERNGMNLAASVFELA